MPLAMVSGDDAADSLAAAERDLSQELAQQESALAGVREAMAAGPDPELAEVEAHICSPAWRF